MSLDSTKQKALDLTVTTIERQYGKGAIMRLGEGETLVPDVPVIPSGSISLDTALGVGGYPRGRVVEIYGPESSGKTTLALHAIAEAQAQGGVAAFIDAEHAIDVAYSRRLGVKTDELLISQPDTGEQALEITDMLVRSNAVDVVVIDSVAALVPKAELEGDMGDSHVGLQARLMSQALRKLTASVSKSQTCLIFINQIRMKIGVMFGSPETTTGGQALKFYSTIRLDVRRVGTLKSGDVVTGSRARVKVVKNKIAPPFRLVEFDLLHGEGINRLGDLLDFGVEAGVIDKSGAWYSYKGDRIGQGRENVRQYLLANDELRARMEAEVREAAGLPGRAADQKEEAPEEKATKGKKEKKKEKGEAGPASGKRKRGEAGASQGETKSSRRQG